MSFFNRHGRWRAQLLAAAVLVAVGAVCVSCGAAEKPAALVGQWVLADGGGRIEMFSDGTGVVDGESMTWKVENKRLMILTSSFGIACDYKTSGYELVLTYDNEKSATFVKKGNLEEYKKKREEEKKKREEEKKMESERIKKEAEARIGKISTYFTDSRNGQKYRTVTVGGKTWMAQNVNYQTGNSWCYENNNSNCDKYGRLYDWATAKTACPSGWHLPSREEWNGLVASAGGGGAGMSLKSTSGWTSDGNGTDEYGFSALPGGDRITDGRFDRAGKYGLWWTTTKYEGNNAYYRSMDYDKYYVDETGYGAEGRGFSVRCLRD